MANDPSQFATPDEQNKIRQQLLSEYSTSQQALGWQSSDVSALKDYSTGVQQEGWQSYRQDASALSDYASGVQQQSTANDSDLRQKAAAFQMSGAPTAQQQQSALAATLQAPIGFLNKTLEVLDTPRKWTFDNVVLPGLRATGAIGQDQKVEDNGRGVYLATFGAGADAWMKDHLQSFGMDAGWADRISSIPGRAVGLGADILLDPVTYLTLGAGSGVKAGGRVLSGAGKDLLGELAGSALSYGTANRIADLADAALGVGRATGETADIASSLKNKVLPTAAGLAREPVRVTAPEADQLFSMLRATGTGGDLFKAGGAQLRLPFNSVSLHLPILNHEESVGLFLGGRDISGGTLRKFNDLRRTAVDLGEGALAAVPLPIREAASATVTPFKGVVDKLFVPYSTLQGWGRDVLKESLKRVENIGRAEQNEAARSLNALFTGVSEDERRRAFYWLDVGAVAGTRDPVTGAVTHAERETFDDFAIRQLQEQGIPITQDSFNQAQQGIAERLTTQKDVLQSRLAQVGTVDPTTGLASNKAQFAGFQVAPQDLGGLRGGATGPAPIPGAQLIQDMINRVDSALTTGSIEKRMDTKALVKELETATAARRAGGAVAPTTLEQIEPNQRVRELLSGLLAEETATTPAGPIHALLQHALDFGSTGTTGNYLRHIRDVNAPGVAKYMKGQGGQLGVRIPSNIGKQRITSFLAEPEELQALGYVTDPEAILSKTLGQYKTIAREGQFVRWTLENFGRRLGPGENITSATEDVFKPREWFTRGVPTPDDLDSQLRFFKESGGLHAEEADAIINEALPRGLRDETWVLPRDVIDGLKQNRQIVDHVGGLFPAVDAAVSVQRSMVTLMWPAYHVRNLTGNLINSHMGGVSAWDTASLAEAAQVVKGEMDSTLGKGLLKVLESVNPGAASGAEASVAGNVLGGMSMAGPLGTDVLGQATSQQARDPKQMLDWFRKYLQERGILGAGQSAVETSVRNEGTAPLLGGLRAIQGNPLFTAGRTASEAVDNTMRVRHVLGRLKAGDTLEDAVLSTKKFLFDFNDLTEVERNLFRPTAFFYTWMRKNLPLQMEMMATEPKNLQHWNALFRNMSDPESKNRADAALMPAYLREQLGMVLGADKDGKLQVLSGLGLPIEDLNLLSNIPTGRFDKLARQFIGLTNPLLQGVAAMAGTPTSFTGKSIYDDSLQNTYRKLDPWLGNLAKDAPGLRDAIGLRTRTVVGADGKEQTLYDANPAVIYAVYNIFAMGRALRVAGDVSDTASSLSSKPLSESGPRLAGTVANNLTGMKQTTVDMSRPLDTLATSERSMALDKETNTALDDLAVKADAGQITPTFWREQRRLLLTAKSNRRDQLLSDQLRADETPIGKTDLKTVQSFRDTFSPPQQRLTNMIFDLEPTGDNPLTGKPFASSSEFAETRSELMSRLKKDFPDVQKTLDTLFERRIAGLSPAAQKRERDYQSAVTLIDEYETVPKYTNLTSEEATRVDDLAKVRASYSQAVGPNQANQMLQQRDPEGYALLRRAKRNTDARKKKWQELNRQGNGLLSHYFGNLPLEESAVLSQLTGPAAATPGQDLFG